MKESEKNRQIKSILMDRGWLNTVEEICFLAAGEYNENHVVISGGQRFVFRINHGSQINQTDQIRYEFNVLQAVAPSGVTPRPFQVASYTPLGGVILMEYIDGRAFDFDRDLSRVPEIFAAVHRLPLPEPMPDPPLLRQPDPIKAIADESHDLLNRFEDHPRQKERSALLAYHDALLDLRQKHLGLFAAEPLCLVNTEVNSGNFIIQPERGVLVDWEKAVISCRYQDLAHFIIPTTTLWKTDFRFTPDTRRHFLAQYHNALDRPMTFEELDRKTAILEKTILLRALSWCFMAWYEYTRQDRALTDNTTFAKITFYLEQLECFLK